MKPTIAALFVSGRSIYRHMPQVRAYGAKEDALTFKGKEPVIAHPPCRTWSKYLKHQAKPKDLVAEQNLALFALEKVFANGGVLEHPAGSELWQRAKLPGVGDFTDPFCYTLYIEQSWFGHYARKPTWILVCGVPIAWAQKPPMRFHANSLARDQGNRAERSHTPKALAEWLCQISQCSWWQHK